MPESPTTEIPCLLAIYYAAGGTSSTPGTTEVPILSSIVSVNGATPTATTEVGLLSQWLTAVSPGTVPGTTEVAILMQLVSAYGGVPTSTTEVPLLLDILAILESADSAPVNTVSPVVSPINLVQGILVSCTTGSWTDFPTSYAYQWLGDGLPIGGANSSTYTVLVGDVGTALSCEVTASNSFGPSTPAVSNSTNPVGAGFTYFRPGGIYTYFRPDGISLFLRP